jgi:hypothetical protein
MKIPGEIGKAIQKAVPKVKDPLFFSCTKEATNTNDSSPQDGSVVASLTRELTWDEWVRFVTPATRLSLLTRALQKHSSKESKDFILQKQLGALQTEMTTIKGEVADLRLRLVNAVLVTSSAAKASGWMKVSVFGP